jgi:hypothetical protein
VSPTSYRRATPCISMTAMTDLLVRLVDRIVAQRRDHQ